MGFFNHLSRKKQEDKDLVVGMDLLHICMGTNKERGRIGVQLDLAEYFVSSAHHSFSYIIPLVKDQVVYNQFLLGRNVSLPFEDTVAEMYLDTYHESIRDALSLSSVVFDEYRNTFGVQATFIEQMKETIKVCLESERNLPKIKISWKIDYPINRPFLDHVYWLLDRASENSDAYRTLFHAYRDEKISAQQFEKGVSELVTKIANAEYQKYSVNLEAFIRYLPHEIYYGLWDSKKDWRSDVARAKADYKKKETKKSKEKTIYSEKFNEIYPPVQDDGMFIRENSLSFEDLRSHYTAKIVRAFFYIFYFKRRFINAKKSVEFNRLVYCAESVAKRMYDEKSTTELLEPLAAIMLMRKFFRFSIIYLPVINEVYGRNETMASFVKDALLQDGWFETLMSTTFPDDRYPLSWIMQILPVLAAHENDIRELYTRYEMTENRLNQPDSIPEAFKADELELGKKILPDVYAALGINWAELEERYPRSLIEEEKK